ncbi:MAG TPA: hypothetical protein VGQ33_03740 [Vicinamibacteria bacterium]|nr:hypothetical protein [Vicinamibacteria bacterium]
MVKLPENRSLTVVLVLLAALACDKKRSETVVKQAGSKVGEALTEFASGVSKGVDTKMVVAVELSPAVAGKGLSRTVAKSLGMDGTDKGFSTYMVSKAPFRGTLVARALGGSGEEIGRARQGVSFERDDAKYVTFKFQPEMDTGLVARYVIDLGK